MSTGQLVSEGSGSEIQGNVEYLICKEASINNDGLSVCDEGRLVVPNISIPTKFLIAVRLMHEYHLNQNINNNNKKGVVCKLVCVGPYSKGRWKWVEEFPEKSLGLQKVIIHCLHLLLASLFKSVWLLLYT